MIPTSDARNFNRAKLEAIERIRRDHRLLDSHRTVGAELFSLVRFETGDAWPSEAYLATQVGKHERTIKRAIAALKELGYVTVVKRGRSNRYQPNFEAGLGTSVSPIDAQQGTPVSPIETGQGTPVSEIGDTGVQNRGHGCPPISLDKSLRASARAREMAKLAGAPDGAGASPSPDLGPPGELLRERLGAARFQSWFGDVAVIGTADGVLTIAATTTFKRDYLRQHFSTDLLIAWRAAGAAVERVEVIVRAAGAAPAALVGGPENVPGARWLLDAGRAIVRDRMLVSDHQAQVLIVGWLAQARNDAPGLAAILADTDAQGFIGDRFCDVIVQRIGALRAPKDQRELPLLGNVRRAHG